MVIGKKSTYYDEHYRQTASLIRARQPYLVKNIFTGLGLFSVVVGIYIMTFRLVGQDDFSDVPMPPATSSSIQRGDGGTGGTSVAAQIPKDAFKK